MPLNIRRSGGKIYIYSTKKNTEDTDNLSELLKGFCAWLLLEHTK